MTQPLWLCDKPFNHPSTHMHPVCGVSPSCFAFLLSKSLYLWPPFTVTTYLSVGTHALSWFLGFFLSLSDLITILPLWNDFNRFCSSLLGYFDHNKCKAQLEELLVLVCLGRIMVSWSRISWTLKNWTQLYSWCRKLPVAKDWLPTMCCFMVVSRSCFMVVSRSWSFRDAQILQSMFLSLEEGSRNFC